MVRNLHAKFIKKSSSFAHATMAAYVIGIGDILCVVGDLYWLFGDMAIQTHPHHYVVLTILSIAGILITASFIYLISSMNKYVRKQEEAKEEQLDLDNEYIEYLQGGE